MTVSQSLECSFGAGVLQKHLTSLRAEVAGVRQAIDIEPIHRMRVASRRLRAALPLFADCFSKRDLKAWQKQLRTLTGALGSARDTDVQIELLQKTDAELTDLRNRPGLRRLLLRLLQQRQGLQKGVDAALDQLEKKDFYNDMDARLCKFQTDPPVEPPYPHQLYQHSATAILELLDTFLSYESTIQNPENTTELHAMRIAAKKLRYTMETFTPLYPEIILPFGQAVKTSQELLGDIHDCDVWLGQLPDFIEAECKRTLDYYGHANPMHPLLPGLHTFQENRIRERDRRYVEFIEVWQKWKEADLWNRLRDLVNAPVVPVIYPPAAALSEPVTE